MELWPQKKGPEKNRVGVAKKGDQPLSWPARLFLLAEMWAHSFLSYFLSSPKRFWPLVGESFAP